MGHSSSPGLLTAACLLYCGSALNVGIAPPSSAAQETTTVPGQRTRFGPKACPPTGLLPTGKASTSQLTSSSCARADSLSVTLPRPRSSACSKQQVPRLQLTRNRSCDSLECTRTGQELERRLGSVLNVWGQGRSNWRPVRDGRVGTVGLHWYATSSW